jgi:hypothetical protein
MGPIYILWMVARSIELFVQHNTMVIVVTKN